ncbi:hypothetical protein ACFX11_027380 [Malus domestica]
MSVLSQFFTSAVNLQKPNNLKLSQKTHRFTRLSSPISDAQTVTFPSLPKLEPECACLFPGRHRNRHKSELSLSSESSQARPICDFQGRFPVQCERSSHLCS